MGLLIRGSCVLGYAKVKRMPHLGFTPAYIALMSAVYWLLCNKWAVYCKCGLAARLCVMYSPTCVVLAVSLMYYTFTVSKVIVMHITLQQVRMGYPWPRMGYPPFLARSGWGTPLNRDEVPPHRAGSTWTGDAASSTPPAVSRRRSMCSSGSRIRQTRECLIFG